MLLIKQQTEHSVQTLTPHWPIGKVCILIRLLFISLSKICLIAIRDLINRGKIEEAEELIQKYFPSVLTQDDPAFALKRLQFVELIRAKKIEEAVQFSRTHLHKYLDSHGDAIKVR